VGTLLCSLHLAQYVLFDLACEKLYALGQSNEAGEDAVGGIEERGGEENEESETF